MARRLSASERALWQRVASTVRPLAGRPAAPAPQAKPVAEPVVEAPLPPPQRAPPRLPVARPLPSPALPVTAATLDGGWDRRLRHGDIRPDRVIDLHDHSLAAAHEVLDRALHAAIDSGDRIILVITGKGRSDRPGRIRAELGHWLESGSHRGRIAALRPAHPRHGGGGAFYLILRRRS